MSIEGAANGAALELAALRLTFGDAVAPDGLTFSVRPGGCCGFVGRNGAGETTTMLIRLRPARR
jgi:ABC-2 type transport system ATP-binding protein